MSAKRGYGAFGFPVLYLWVNSRYQLSAERQECCSWYFAHDALAFLPGAWQSPCFWTWSSFSPLSCCFLPQWRLQRITTQVSSCLSPSCLWFSFPLLHLQSQSGISSQTDHVRQPVGKTDAYHLQENGMHHPWCSSKCSTKCRTCLSRNLSTTAGIGPFKGHSVPSATAPTDLSIH